MDRIYAISNPATKTAYVGRTARTLAARWSEHLRCAANHLNGKRLYEAMRHDPMGFDIEELEHSATASEAEWVAAYLADGWTLLNDTSGDRVQPRKRQAVPKVDDVVITEEDRVRYRAWLDIMMIACHERIG